jgi:transcriptional regulator with XRE-family HTH domain
MSDQSVGAAFRAVRLRRGWRQADVANTARVSRALVSLVERGHLGTVSVESVRRIGAVLDIRIDVVPRWRGGELDRLLNSGHSSLAVAVTTWLQNNGWIVAPEVSFSVFGERGFIDLLAWHPATRTVLVIELKTAIVDVQELVGVTDRKTRLAKRIAAERGWSPLSVGTLVVVSDTATNRRRVADHASVLRSAYPADGRNARKWLRRPLGVFAALAFYANANRGSSNSSMSGRQRVRPSVRSER